MRKQVPKAGFTLIELMVVVVIMAIIFALVAYSVNRMLPNMQIATAGQQLLGAVGQARMLAVTKSAYVKLRLVSTGLPLVGKPPQDSIEILVKSPMDTLYDFRTNFVPVSIVALSQGVKFQFNGNVEYNFWRDGSLESSPARSPIIYCLNRPTTVESLSVMKATGIAELNH